MLILDLARCITSKGDKTLLKNIIIGHGAERE